MFKQCQTCQLHWNEIEDFLSDHEILLQGYQVHPFDPGKGLFLFLHNTKNCQTTFAIKVEVIQKGLSFGRKLAFFHLLQNNCQGFCKDRNNLFDCGNKSCEGNTIRQLIQTVNNFPKKHSA